MRRHRSSKKAARAATIGKLMTISTTVSRVGNPLVKGRPGLPPEQADRVLDALRKLLQERFGQNVTALAQVLGRSQSAISQILAGRNKPSYETAQRTAEYLGIPVSDLLVPGARGDALAVPMGESGFRLRILRDDEASDPSPERAEALHFARANRLPEEAIVRTRAMDPILLSPEQWYDRIKVEVALLGSAGGATRSRSAPPGAPVAPSTKRSGKSKGG